jgi:N-acetylneuraminic acid mutarotase
MIVWGGANINLLKDGGRYNPAGNSWTLIASFLSGAPSARGWHTAVWTGSEMIIWGGTPGLNDGGRYNPAGDSWAALSPSGLAGRSQHTAVWTGAEMIVWGGTPNNNTSLNDGARYNPGANSWTPVSGIGGPAGRSQHTAIWTGSEMIVWGGNNAYSFNSTAIFNDTISYTPGRVLYLYQRP